MIIFKFLFLYFVGGLQISEKIIELGIEENYRVSAEMKQF